jgi:hypothetical protein
VTTNKHDIIIIGGGIIGLACAHYLIEQGASVTIIEDKQAGSGASHRNCGLLFFSDVITLCAPGAVSTEILRTLRGISPLYIKSEPDIEFFGPNAPHLQRFCTKLQSLHTLVRAGFVFACAFHIGNFLSKHGFSVEQEFRIGFEEMVENTDAKKGFSNRPMLKNPLKIDLLDSYIDRCRSFLSVLYIKSDPVTLIKRFKACCVDAGMMHEYVRSLLLFDKSVSLCIIKPLYDPICHCDSLLTCSE